MSAVVVSATSRSSQRCVQDLEDRVWGLERQLAAPGHIDGELNLWQ